MSDGMSDSKALGKLEADLREAAYVLRDALRAAEEGHRGWTVGGYAQLVNAVLAPDGWEVRRTR